MDALKDFAYDIFFVGRDEEKYSAIRVANLRNVDVDMLL
jgi:hypothetical protein